MPVLMDKSCSPNGKSGNKYIVRRGGGGWGLRHPPVAHQDDVQVRPFSSKLFIAKPMLLLYTYKPGINLAN